MTSPPPTYDDVMREDEQARGYKLRSFTKNSFSILNYSLAGIGAIALFLIKFCKVMTMHKHNVKNYCKDPNYKRSLVQNSSNTIALVFIFANVGAIILATFIYKSMEKKSWMSFMKRLVLDVASYFIHMGFLILTLELLTIKSGLPAPYFFSNSDLESWYCDNVSKTETMPHYLDLEDQASRETFPSQKAALHTFCIIFLYLYVDHFDVTPGFHTTQQCIVMCLGIWSLNCIYSSVKLGEYHLEDVVVGYVIGALQAIIAIRNIFGTVFYARRHIWLKQDRLPDYVDCVSEEVTRSSAQPTESLSSPSSWGIPMEELSTVVHE